MSRDLLVEPFQRSRLYQQIVLQLCQLIQRGQIRPGNRLPPKRELVEQVGVGRSSIREAPRARPDEWKALGRNLERQRVAMAVCRLPGIESATTKYDRQSAGVKGGRQQLARGGEQRGSMG